MEKTRANDLTHYETKDLVTIYNRCAEVLGKKTINRFADRKAACSRTAQIANDAQAQDSDFDPWSEIEARDEEVEEAPAKASKKAKPLPEPELKLPPKEPKRRGRQVDENYWSTKPINPRKFGTFGFKTHEIILKNPGISSSDLIKKGGRIKDVRWDQAHDYVVTRAPK